MLQLRKNKTLSKILTFRLKTLPMTSRHPKIKNQVALRPKKTVVVPIFKNISRFSDIMDNTVMQVTEIVPSNEEEGIYTAHLSDGEFWVSTSLSEVFGSVIMSSYS